MKELDLSYKQFCIFNESVENPFNEWDDIRIEQGFSLRKESISIMTINQEGILKICILSKEEIIENAKRIIEFEYEITDDFIEIATITEGIKIKVEKGIFIIRVQLVYETEGVDICYISIISKKNDILLPRYLKYDNEIKKTDCFVLNSESAK